MVAGTRRDHQHRDVPPGGDPRDQSLGPVTAGHPEQVGPLVRRVTRQRSHVNRSRAFQQGHLGAERGGLVLQPELGDLAATRPRVHDHERLPLPRRRVFGRTHGRAAAERRAPGGHRSRREHDAERHLPQQPVNDVHHDHEYRRGDQDHQRQPAHDAAVSQEKPRRRAADRQAQQSPAAARQCLSAPRTAAAPPPPRRPPRTRAWPASAGRGRPPRQSVRCALARSAPLPRAATSSPLPAMHASRGLSPAASPRKPGSH